MAAGAYGEMFPNATLGGLLSAPSPSGVRAGVDQIGADGPDIAEKGIVEAAMPGPPADIPEVSTLGASAFEALRLRAAMICCQTCRMLRWVCAEMKQCPRLFRP
jgi:hypothetical protein